MGWNLSRVSMSPLTRLCAWSYPFSTVLSPLKRLLKVRSTDNMVQIQFVIADERCVALTVWYSSSSVRPLPATSIGALPWPYPKCPLPPPGFRSVRSLPTEPPHHCCCFPTRYAIRPIRLSGENNSSPLF